MKRLALLTAAVALFGAWVVAAEPRTDADDVRDVVFQGDAGPVLLRLHIRIDGRPFRMVYREAWDEYLKALFRQLDQDGDGFLSEAEAQRLPPPPRLATGREMGRQTNLAFNYRVVDANGDGKLDLGELVAYYRDYGGAGLVIGRPAPPRGVPAPVAAVEGMAFPAAAPAPAALNDALFNRLDTNHDGRLDADELAAAEAVLMPLDADGDELIAPAELLPRAAVPRPGPRMAMNVTNRPGSASRFLFPGAADGTRDAREPENLAGQSPTLELLVRLGELREGEKPLDVLTPGAGARLGDDGTVLVNAGKTLLEVRANWGRPTLVPHLRQRYVDQFRAAAGKKDHLTFSDAQAAGFFPAQFAILDQNGDGRLTEQELQTYLDEVQEHQARALTSGVAVLVSDQGRGLFDLLDRNRDGKLSRRELRSARRLLAQLGREKEGLSRDDVPSSYQLAVGVCQASFDRVGGHGVLTPAGMPLLALDWSRPGLVWFDKMDRNRDGDVSPREFLGSREDFRRLDADGDGLISLEEALRAERLLNKERRGP
jgi:Ca2+-binding EF-hand superfamily protein